MLCQLLELINSYEFEETHGWLALRSISFNGDQVAVDLTVQIGSDSEGWRVSCSECADYRFDNGFIPDIRLESDHPLLWRFNELQRGLYFSGSCRDRDAVVSRLVTTHVALVGDAYRYGEFLNPLIRTSELLDSGFGLFAEGPLPLIDAYEAVLAESGLSVSGPPPRSPMRWRDGRWVEADDWFEIVLLGTSFVIGHGFEAARL